MKDIIKIKELEQQLLELQAQEESLKKMIANKQRVLSTTKKEIDNVLQEIDKLSNKTEIKISDHAIVRYFQRVKGIDLDQVRKEILSPSVLSWVETLGDGTYPSQDCKLVIRDNTVVTVMKGKL